MTIALQKVSFSYPLRGGMKKIFDRLDLSFAAEESIGIMGEEGCGKSTLLQIMAALLRPDEGTLVVEGNTMWTDPKKDSLFRRDIGYLFQFPEHQFLHETVEAEVTTRLTARGLARNEIEERAESMFDACKLSRATLWSRSPFSLSMGEARRLALACVMIANPRIVFLDEPTVGVDSAGLRILVDVLSKHHQERKGIILASHDVDFVSAVVTRIVLLGEGIEHDISSSAFLENATVMRKYGYVQPEVTQCMGHL